MIYRAHGYIDNYNNETYSIEKKLCFNSSNKEKKEGYFPTEALAKKDYRRCERLANKKLKQIEKDLVLFEKKNKCHISFYMDGDTFGIYESGMMIIIVIEDYMFEKRMEE